MPSDRLLFGWCLPYSSEHQACKTSFTYEGKDVVCGCTCHGASVDTSVTTSEDENDGASALSPKIQKSKKEKGDTHANSN